MARLFINSQNKLPFYTVTASVGEGGTNNRIDVMLVQLMLRVASEPASFSILPPGEQPLKVDGNCGPTTIRHIRNFQSEIKRRFNSPIPSKIDGRVDPAVRSGSTNTMTLLNGAFRKRHANMHLNESPFITVDLVNEFFVVAHTII